MTKLCYALRIVAAVLVVGTVGAVENDNIGLWTGVIQGILGITLWILAGYWLTEIKYYENEKVR